MVIDGHAAAGPALRRAVNVFLGERVSGEEWLQWGILAQMATMALWDFDSYMVVSTRSVEFARALGVLAPLSIALNGQRDQRERATSRGCGIPVPARWVRSGIVVGLRGMTAAPLAACTTLLSPQDWADQGTDQGVHWYGAPVENFSVIPDTTLGRRQ